MGVPLPVPRAVSLSGLRTRVCVRCEVCWAGRILQLFVLSISVPYIERYAYHTATSHDSPTDNRAPPRLLRVRRTVASRSPLSRVRLRVQPKTHAFTPDGFSLGGERPPDTYCLYATERPQSMPLVVRTRLPYLFRSCLLA